MKQISLGLNLSTKKTRKREFLEEMNKVVPWDALVQIVAPYCAKAKTGRPAFAIELDRLLSAVVWAGDPAMEEALHDMPLYRSLQSWTVHWIAYLMRAPSCAFATCWRRITWPLTCFVVADLLGYKGLLLKTGTAVDATLIDAPSSTKNASGERDQGCTRPRKGTSGTSG